MLIDGLLVEYIYLACGHTDMRKSIDGLAACIQKNFRLDPFSNNMFLFCGIQRDRIKSKLFTGKKRIRAAVQAAGEREKVKGR
jgi:transposase